jgi:hypothetical protein
VSQRVGIALGTRTRRVPYVGPPAPRATRFRRLVDRLGGFRGKGAQKRAIIAISHTLLKIAYSVLKTGKLY